MNANILIGLLLSVAGFAAGWGISTLRQRYTTSAQEQARVEGQAIPEPFRYALSTIEGKQVFTDLGEERLKRGTVSPKQNLSNRYEPS